jgi:hypothetical protein
MLWVKGEEGACSGAKEKKAESRATLGDNCRSLQPSLGSVLREDYGELFLHIFVGWGFDGGLVLICLFFLGVFSSLYRIFFLSKCPEVYLFSINADDGRPKSSFFVPSNPFDS